MLLIRSKFVSAFALSGLGGISATSPAMREFTRYLSLIRGQEKVGAGAVTFFGLRAASIQLNAVQQTAFCRVLWRGTVRSRVLGAATLFLAFQLLAAASAPAQGPLTTTAAAWSTAGLFRYWAKRYHVVAPRHSYWHSPPPRRLITAAAAAAAGHVRLRRGLPST